LAQTKHFSRATRYRHRYSPLWLWLCLFCCLNVCSSLQADVILQNPQYLMKITQNVSYFEDKDNQYGPDSFLNPEIQQQFTPARTPVLRMGYTDATLWLQLEIKSELEFESNALLYVNLPNIGLIRVYQRTDDGMKLLEEVGSLTPHLFGFIRHRSPAVRLQLNPAVPSDILVEVRSQQYMTFTLNLADPASFYELQFKQHLILGVTLGALLMLIIYGVFGKIRNRDKSYLSYTLYALSIAFYIMVSYGYIGYYWFPVTGLQVRLESASLIALCICSLFFTQKLLDLHRTRHHLNTVLQTLIVVNLLSLVLINFIDQQFASKMSVSLALICIPLASYATALRAFDRFSPARILIIPRVILALIGALTAQTVFGLLAIEFETLNVLVSALCLDCVASVYALQLRSQIHQKAEEQQRQRIAVAEAERRAKTEFLAQLSHEIRTPMNGILGMSELLEDSPLTPSQQDYVRTITYSGNNLLKILDDILDYSKIETGKMTLDFTSFDIGSMLSECIDLFRQRAEEKGIELITHIQGDVPFQVKGDTTRIRQVLANLISNAIKFTDHGEVVIDINKDAERSENHIRFSVTDTGTGISREALQDILKTDRNHLEQLGHRGLGLPISQQLVGIMHGSFGAKSAPNKGSSFWFSIPLEPDPEGQDIPLYADQLNGLRLLIVDDNASCRLVIQQQASSWGMTLATAVNGKQALALLHNQATIHEPFDVVILDHEMPGMTGMELAARIKEDTIINNDPLVMMLTGLGMAPSATAARNAGIRRVISKPVTGRVLKVALLEELAHIRRIHANHPQDTYITRQLPAMSILVAEDHHLSQKVVRGMLTRLGMQAVTVENGKAALEKVQQQQFDLILMDCEMPEMNGFEATVAIRQWEQECNRKPIPIIALTAHIMDEHKERSLRCGMNAHLAKPIELNELRDILLLWSDHPGSVIDPAMDNDNHP